MIEPEASLVAPVEPVDHVLDALDVAPVGESGAVCGAAGGDRGLLRLHAARRSACQPGEGEKYFAAAAQISKSCFSKVDSCQLEAGQTTIFSAAGQI